MANKITSQHVKYVASVASAGVVLSALTYWVPRPAPVYDAGQLQHYAHFMAHDAGWPLTYLHYACYGLSDTCHLNIDVWGFLMNAAFLAVAAALTWLLIHRVGHHRTKRAAKRGKKK
jgi:hypothetical protein